MLPVAPEGYPFILVPGLSAALLFLFGYQLAAGLLLLVALACLAFFRDPLRTSHAPPDAILSPADGRVLSVAPAPAAVAPLGLATQLSIFMSPADVHVNRAPISGTVREVRLVAGRKFPAFRDKASELNEHSFVVLEGEGVTVAYKQIAGALARRVVCDLEPGQGVTRGQRVGMIKFGSRVDLFLPPSAHVLVAAGERTRAGLTVVARLAQGGES
ncbi:MAG: phosphatidylserine decarboxylase [Thermoanaerobaculaceae bacterium]|nr:phosphatidylserine decarboxylase [Thermoanaerobaculaceae bacterium]